MTIEMIEDIAMDILKAEKFGNIPLFEMDSIDDYVVTDEEGTMALSEFLAKYTEKIINEITDDKQIPKPIIQDDYYEELQYCPACNRTLTRFGEKDIYCRFCGQKLMYESEED